MKDRKQFNMYAPAGLLKDLDRAGKAYAKRMQLSKPPSRSELIRQGIGLVVRREELAQEQTKKGNHNE